MVSKGGPPAVTQVRWDISGGVASEEVLPYMTQSSEPDFVRMIHFPR